MATFNVQSDGFLMSLIVKGHPTSEHCSVQPTGVGVWRQYHRIGIGCRLYRNGIQTNQEPLYLGGICFSTLCTCYVTGKTNDQRSLMASDSHFTYNVGDSIDRMTSAYFLYINKMTSFSVVCTLQSHAFSGTKT